MIKEISIRVLPQQASSETQLKEFLSSEYALNKSDIYSIRILKRSIDARKRQVMINLTLCIFINELPPENDTYDRITYRDVSRCPQVVIVGAGPAGLFAALRSIELGWRPIVVERGQDVHQRRKDIARITRENVVDSESNYCFGEGGAGAFSDGKLYTRSKKRGSVDRILSILC
ncbi:MAG: FAD-binding protein, partial [Porphyromonadaceae bacterium]|nr:FAD-binding protein [Porphyromonadaceae bacterium]